MQSRPDRSRYRNRRLLQLRFNSRSIDLDSLERFDETSAVSQQVFVF